MKSRSIDGIFGFISARGRRRPLRFVALATVALLPAYLVLSAPTAANADPDIQISGTVSASSGSLDSNATVELFDSTNAEVDSTGLNDDGTYLLDEGDLASGDYTVTFSDNPGFATASDDVPIDGASVGGVDATLDAVPLTPITGTVSGPADLTGVDIAAYTADGDNWDHVNDVLASSDGTYSLLVPVGSYRIAFTDESGDNGLYEGQVYNGINTDDPSNADGATLLTNPGSTLSGIDAHLIKRTTIEGTVQDSSGPAANVDVQLWTWDGAEFEQGGDTSTNSAGVYNFGAQVAAGNYYTLYFDTSDSDSPGMSEFLNGTQDVPTDTGDASTVNFTGAADVTENITLPDAPKATGSVTDQSDGTPLQGALVHIYRWDGAGWDQAKSATAGVDGTWSAGLSIGDTFTISARANGYHTAYLGGGSALPDSPSPANSFVNTADGVTVPTISLVATASTLGKVAGEKLSYCTAHTLDANDDGSTGAVTLPFTLDYFGNAYSQLYVNNNGNVTFGNPSSVYTPGSLSGATSQPIIAPFFADVDTRNDNSGLVTYGVSPDHSTFCVNWPDVGYFNTQSDKVNTFQLLLTDQSSAIGRSAGDFDITFNYDQILWETGDASGGTGGTGGISAAAGFSAGTGDAGTYFQLPGSLVNGALVDGGANALVAGQQNSTQVGRYVFQVRNTGAPVAFGAIDGHVTDSIGGAEAGVDVEAFDDSHTYFTQTDGSGGYSLSGVQAGTYTVRAFPSGNLFERDVNVVVATATADNPSSHAPDIVLSAPVAPASNVTVGGSDRSTTSDGVPVVYYGDPIPLTVSGQCSHATVTYSVSVGGVVVGSGSLHAVSGHPTTYTTTIPALYPAHGAGVVSYSVACPTGPPVSKSFDIYLDPSGIVVNQFGAPLAGATVTILTSDTETGTYTAVPNGSDVLSPSNRANPATTGADGLFSWDVAPGWYEVRVSGTGITTTTTDPMQVPPERTRLVITATKAGLKAPVPSKAPAISGTFAAGKRVTVSNGTWPAGMVVEAITWKAGANTVGTGSSYVIQGADVGQTITAIVTAARHVDGNIAGLSDQPTTYDFPVNRIVVGKKVVKGVFSMATPKFTGTAVVGQTLTAVATATPASPTLTYQWLRSGKPITVDGTSSTYVLGALDGGKTISVQVTATGTGFTTLHKTSATKTVLKLLTATPTPTISGTVAVGDTLTAVPGLWTPATVTLTYQWYADTSAIKSATKSSFKITAALAGKSIWVMVTGKKSGYATVSEGSDLTDPVP